MKHPLLLLITIAALTLSGCNSCGEHGGHADEDGHDEHAGEAEHGDEHGDEHAGHAHGEGSDLDRPVPELFAASCEHGVKAHTCDECRYEVGVCKVPAALIDEGLVQVAQVARQAPKEALTLTGEVQLDERLVVHVGARTPGIIRKVHVQPGQQVKKQDPLLVVDSSQVGEAQGESLEAQAALELAAKRLDRLTELRDGGVTSAREFQKAEQEHQIAKIRARVSAAKLGRLGAGKSAGGGRLTIRAPSDGTVIEMHAVVGETTEPDQSVMVIGDLGTLWVFADLYEADLARVLRETGAGEVPAGVLVKAFGDREFTGKIGLVSSTMDRATRTVKVRVDVANPEGLLRPGMFANVKLYLAAAGEVIAVPQAALLQDEGRFFLFRHHEGDYFVRRPVTPGRRWGNFVEITAGLAGGERIVTDGSFLLKSDVLRSKMGAGCAD